MALDPASLGLDGHGRHVARRVDNHCSTSASRHPTLLGPMWYFGGKLVSRVTIRHKVVPLMAR